MSKAVFLEGSILRHILTMTISSAIGLLALFGVDLVDMYFLSLLGQEELAAAIGFSGTLLFFLTSVGIGIQIAMGALVSRAEGADDHHLARRYASSVMLFSVISSTLAFLPARLFLEEILRYLGATGNTLNFAIDYCNILLPSTPILACGISAAAALRGMGDAKNAMYTTLGGALVNAVFNPVFIFGLGLGIQGAAIATVLGRLALAAIAFYVAIHRHKLDAVPTWGKMMADLKVILPISLPAILTNLATPIGSGYILKTMSSFGDSAVAGAAIVGRITPVAFALVFALSGAIGPIVGQNAAADRYDRVRSSLFSALGVNFGYILMAWLAMYLTTDIIIAAFSAEGESAELIRFYNTFLVGGFAFNGVLYVANAASNNLGRATQATAFNYARTLFGTLPFVYLLSAQYGAKGVFMGELAGAMVWGVIAFAVVIWQVSQLGAEQRRECPPVPASGQLSSGFSSPQCQLSTAYARSPATSAKTAKTEKALEATEGA